MTNVAAGHERTSRSGGTPRTPLLRVVPPAGMHNDDVWGDWRDRGACRGQDSELFFPGEHQEQVPAKQFCAVCPVRVECLEYALAGNIQHGIWGGLSINSRREIRKQRYRAQVARDRAVRDAAAPALPALPSRTAHP